MNLASIVRDHAREQASKPALYFHDRVIRFDEAWRLIEGIAALLHANGIGNGDRVGLSMLEHPLHLLSHFAVARLQAVIIPMDHRWTATEKKDAAIAFNTRLVLTDGGEIGGIDTLELNESDIVQLTVNLPEFKINDADLLVSLSSGTTGKPKGAIVTHRNMYERFVSQWKAIGYGRDDCFAILTPFYFGAGRSFGMSLLSAGGSVRIAPPPLQPEQVLSTLSDPGITATFLPPTLLRRLFEFHKAGEPPLLGNIEYLISSGEPLFADEAQQCIEKICPNLFSYYASSEGGGISVLRAEEFPQFAATVGKPTYKTEVQIVNENDEDVGSNTVGRLRYRGPGVSTRYLDGNGDEGNSGVGGWFYPGDLAEILKSGHIALRGRDKDVIIRGGINIYPSEIEAVLLQHASISDAAVIGVQDKGRGEIVVAFIESDDIDEPQLEAWCKDRLAPYKVPRQFVIIETMPKRSSGKTDKKALLLL